MGQSASGRSRPLYGPGARLRFCLGSAFGDELVEGGGFRWGKAGGLQQAAEQAFAAVQPGQHFAEHSRERKFLQVQPQRFDHAMQNRAATGAVWGLAGAAGLAGLGGVSQRSFGFVVGPLHFRVQHECEQLILTQQTHQFMHQVEEVLFRITRR